MSTKIRKQKPKTKKPSMPIYAIARDIWDNWKTHYRDKPVRPAFYVRGGPYLHAMLHIATCDEHFGLEDGEMIVLRFLNAVTTWRGDAARKFKEQLKAHLPTHA